MFLHKKTLVMTTLIMSLFVMVQVGNSSKPTGEVKAIIVDSVQIEQDLLFAQINKSFESVKPILENSCYDCHSAMTKEPWYFNLPGINGLIIAHIEDGRRHLDFTDGFPFKSKEPILEILHELKEEVEEGEMPILGYRIFHWGSLIEGEQQDVLFEWISETETALTQFYKKHNIPYKSE